MARPWWTPLAPGYYAVAIHNEDGHEIGYRTARRKPGGFQFGAYYFKPETDRQEQCDACNIYDAELVQWFIEEAPDEARRTYGKFTGQCAICNRKLTDPASKLNGIGPECAKAVA